MSRWSTRYVLPGVRSLALIGLPVFHCDCPKWEKKDGFLLQLQQEALSRALAGKFENGAATFAFLRLASDAADYYQSHVGYTATPLPGYNKDGSMYYWHDKVGRQYPNSWGQDVVGLNSPLIGPWYEAWNVFKQGGALGRALNVVPTINAIAGLHDYWWNRPGPTPFNFVTNVGTMLPAAVLTEGALIGRLTAGWDTHLSESDVLLQ